MFIIFFHGFSHGFSPFCLVRFRQVLLLGSEGLPEGAVLSLKWGRPADAVDRWRGGSPGQRCWYTCHKPKKYDITGITMVEFDNFLGLMSMVSPTGYNYGRI